MGEEVAKPRRIEHARHAHDLVAGQAARLLQGPDHRVQRVGYADHEGVGRVFLDARAHLLHHLEIDLQQIVAAHAGLAGNAGGHNHHIGVPDPGVFTGTGEIRIEALDRRGLGDIERLAHGHALDDVKQNNVAEFLEADQMGQRAADHASADQRNPVARHREAPK